MALPQYGTAPIRCGRTRCKWRGFETDLAKVPGTLGGVSVTQSVCPTCGNDDYSFMTPREVQAWERAKQRTQGGSDGN
ncbi:hypothetical protein SAMN05216359_105336 [Roseateles sp. YR242]|uniref:hypothetical protein n=1 Tax=Roseateles sp. YR242 TaxID=1855305 RepID=UPI0008BED8FC|nr:hypothetical protein [Roseateles sp. YR242]SEL13771.1 hypothetical protein SAMN05216359_105336 [Roseateles sp. YR242]